jgi:hypothetical protein
MRKHTQLGVLGTCMALLWVVLILLFCIGPMTLYGAWAGVRSVLTQCLEAANRILDRNPDA